MLCFYSGFFERILQGESEEANRQPVNLEDEKPRIFEVVMLWLYQRRFEHQEVFDWELAFEVYAFANGYTMPLLQNELIDHLRDEMAVRWMVPKRPPLLKKLDECAGRDSPLRQFVLEVVAKTCTTHDIRPDEVELLDETEVAADLLRLIWIKDRVKWTKADLVGLVTCEWHVHAEGETCGSVSKKRRREDDTLGGSSPIGA